MCYCYIQYTSIYYIYNIYTYEYMIIYDYVTKYLYMYMWNHVKFPMFPTAFQPPGMGPAPRPKSPAMASCHTALVKGRFEDIWKVAVRSRRVSIMLQRILQHTVFECIWTAGIILYLLLAISHVLLTSFEIHHSISASKFSCSTSQSDGTLQFFEFLFNGEGNLNPAAKLKLC